MIDDDRDVLGVQAKVLQQAGFTVTRAENGCEALLELSMHPYQAIVLDLAMPFMEGQRFYRELEDKVPKMAQRVVFVTGMVGDPETQEFLEQSGRPYLGKPVEIDALVSAVRTAVSSEMAGDRR
jgi:DNA-binding response OmpR family regulator